MTVGETIWDIDEGKMIESLAHAFLQHIEFSKGEVLIDDLVGEDEDIPFFQYDLKSFLQIDLDEILRRKEMREWEKE